MKEIQVKIVRDNDSIIIPKYTTEGSAGFDFHITEDITINPHETKLIKTGLRMGIPSGYELQIRPRSGLSLKTKVRVSNSPGTVDCDFIGEIGIILDNIGDTNITFEKGDRIAQGVLNEIIQARFEIVGSLSETERGEDGFGSSGTK